MTGKSTLIFGVGFCHEHWCSCELERERRREMGLLAAALPSSTLQNGGQQIEYFNRMDESTSVVERGFNQAPPPGYHFSFICFPRLDST